MTVPRQGRQRGREKKPSAVAKEAVLPGTFPIVINHLNAILLRVET